MRHKADQTCLPPAYVIRTAKALLVFMAIFTVSGTFAAAFQCNPPKYMFVLEFLMSPDRASHCFSPDISYGIFLYQAVVLFCIDIVILLLPVPALLSLQMTRGKGLVIFMVFGSGTTLPIPV